MPLTALQIKKLKALEERKRYSVGSSLYLIVESKHKARCSRSFIGRMRYEGKQIEVRIGVYGDMKGQWSLTRAKEEWIRLKTWSQETGKDPRELKKEERKKREIKEAKGKLLEELATEYLIHREEVEKKSLTTIKDERNKFNNQILPELGRKTPVRSLGWSSKYQGRTGRQAILKLTSSIESRGSHNQAKKVAGVLKRFFDYAIYKGHLDRNENPASATELVGVQHEEGTNPCLSWDELY